MTLRESLASPREKLLALINLPDPALVEVAAHAGFDAAVLDAEHGPLTISDIQAMVRAGDAAGIPTIARVPETTKEWVLRSLDAGAAGILAPQVDTPAEAARVIGECRYPPEGRRGAGFYARAYRYTLDRGPAAIQAANARIVAGIQIESVAAVEAAPEILATGGVDFAFVGPTDLSVDHGSTDITHPWVVDAIARMAEAGRAAGVPMAVYASTPDAARRYVELGYRIVGVGLVPVLMGAASSYVSEIRALASEIPS